MLKKIMFYINSIHHGGAERVLVNLATQFQKNGYESVLVTSFHTEWEYPCNAVKRLSLYDQKPNFGFFKRNLLFTSKLRKIIKQEKPDVLISFMAEPNFRAIPACLGTKTKNLISVRNDPEKEYGSFFTRLLAKTMFRLADGTVFQTRDAQKWFPKSIQKRSRVIFNQVAENFFATEFTGVRKDIVTAGRLAPQKNHEMLIKAFAEIAGQIEDNLIIYGSGELEQELKDLVSALHLENRVFFPGVIQDVADTIKSAKLFVLSSDFEGMPNVLMEAMTLGLACVSTDCPCGGPRELIIDKENGLLVPVNAPEQLSKAMLYLLKDEKEAERLGRNARNRAERFAPGIIYGQWEAYVKKLSAKGAPDDMSGV